MGDRFDLPVASRELLERSEALRARLPGAGGMALTTNDHEVPPRANRPRSAAGADRHRPGRRARTHLGRYTIRALRLEPREVQTAIEHRVVGRNHDMSGAHAPAASLDTARRPFMHRERSGLLED